MPSSQHLTVLRADAMGMCFGVRNALDTAFARDDAGAITVHGELVHNAVVNDRLRARGFATTDEDARRDMPERPAVLITAHGISRRERARLRDGGKLLIDTTCPLVHKAHDAAMQLSREGWHVVVIGKPGHVEVEGLVGDLESWDVAQDPGSVWRYPFERIGVVSQTTCSDEQVAEVLEEIEWQNPDAEVRFVDTVCDPTRRRVAALEALCGQVGVVVVVGGRNSNNTQRLVRIAEERGCGAHHIQGAGDLEPSWFEGCKAVGLTAGTSTLDETIDAVQSAIEAMPVRKSHRATG